MAELLAPVLTNFDRIGGAAGVDRLVEQFYGLMDTLPEVRALRAMHAANLGPTKEVLKRYLGEWLGGPPLYSQERGHPRLRQRHLRFSIGPAERDAWMLCMGRALDAVVTDATLRERLRDQFIKLADWVRNDPESPHENRRPQNR
jgi:hemoglobin